MKAIIDIPEEAMEAVKNGSANIYNLCGYLMNGKILEPCENAISRQAVLDAMFELCDTGETLKENPWRDNPHIDAITDAINDLPFVTPQPKTGHWIFCEGIGMTENEMALMLASVAVDMQDKDVNDVLDKIRAEIMQLDYDIETVDYDYNDMAHTEEVHTIYREEVLQIIDKYRESEG